MRKDEDATRVLPRSTAAASPQPPADDFALPVTDGGPRIGMEKLDPDSMREPTRRLQRPVAPTAAEQPANVGEGPQMMGAELSAPDVLEPIFGTGPIPLQNDEPTAQERQPMRAPTVPLPRMAAPRRQMNLPPAVQRVVAALEARLGWLPGWLGWVLAMMFFVLLALVVLLGGGGGVSESDLATFFAHIKSGRYADAEALLEDMEPGVAVEGPLRTYLTDGRRVEARRLLGQANRHLRNKNHEQALADARRANELQPDADASFLVAESLRHLERAEASDAYQSFMQTYPDDERQDAAMYWRATRLEKSGDIPSARALYQSVADMPKSSYKKSALRRLKGL